MHVSFKRIISASLFLFILSHDLVSQSNISSYEIGINGGIFIYQGDLTPTRYGSFKTASFVIGINGSRRISKTFALRLDMNIGRVKGDEFKYDDPAWRKQRAFAFRSPVTEIIASAVYNPLGITSKLSPYLFAGLGYSFLNIRRDYSRYNEAYFSSESLNSGLAADIDHALPKAVPIIPLGAGLRYRMTERLSLNSEMSYRVMSTDYLDGFSQSGNPGRKDNYYKYSVGIIYSFGAGNKYDCPVIRQ